MTYRCGIGPGMATIGLMPRDPHVVCDGCGAIKSCYTAHGHPAQWILAGRAPPGWLLIRSEDEETGQVREDYCPGCKAARGRGERRT